MRRASLPLCSRGEHALDRVAHGAQLDEVVVVDREADGALAELGLDRFDDSMQCEVVGVEVFAQARVGRDRVGVDAEHLDELVAHDALDLVGADRPAVAVRLSRHRPSTACVNRSTTPSAARSRAPTRIAFTIAPADDEPCEMMHTPFTPSSSRAAGVVGEQRRGRFEQAQLERVGMFGPRRAGSSTTPNTSPAMPMQRAFERLQRDVAGEPVGDDHVGAAAHAGRGLRRCR